MPHLVINTSTQGYDTKGKRRKRDNKKENLTLLMKPKGADARSKGAGVAQGV